MGQDKETKTTESESEKQKRAIEIDVQDESHLLDKKKEDSSNAKS